SVTLKIISTTRCNILPDRYPNKQLQVSSSFLYRPTTLVSGASPAPAAPKGSAVQSSLSGHSWRILRTRDLDGNIEFPRVWAEVRDVAAVAADNQLAIAFPAWFGWGVAGGGNRRRIIAGIGVGPPPWGNEKSNVGKGAHRSAIPFVGNKLARPRGSTHSSLLLPHPWKRKNAVPQIEQAEAQQHRPRGNNQKEFSECFHHLAEHVIMRMALVSGICRLLLKRETRSKKVIRA